MTTHVLNPALIASVHADERGHLVIVMREHADDTPGSRSIGLGFLIEALTRLQEVE